MEQLQQRVSDAWTNLWVFIGGMLTFELSWLDIILLPFAVYLGFMLTLFIMPLIPNLIERLSNDPNREKPPGDTKREYALSTFGFFTKLSPGQVKIIERGGRFIKAIMDYDEHMFAGEAKDSSLTSDDRGYWEVREINRQAGETESRPLRSPKFLPVDFRDRNPGWKRRLLRGLMRAILYPFRLIWWLWKWEVHAITGYVFTGIYPFQQVRAYRIERFKKEKLENGEEKIERILDYSDHYRVADFQYPMIIPRADTQDKIPVKVTIDLLARVFNPYSTAYDTDDWSSRLSAAAADAVTQYTRTKPIAEVLSATDDTAARELSTRVLQIGSEEDRAKLPEKRKPNTTTTFGIIAIQALVSDISAADAEDGKKLGELARARVAAASEAELAKGRAANLREQAAAVRDNGHIGLAVLASERNVRTAEVAGKQSTVIIGGGSDTDPIQAAILRELQQQNGGNA